jgi:hypothetical protein
MEPRDRHEIRERLAELLREPLDKVVDAVRLRALRGYDPERLRGLAETFGLKLSAERLRSHETVEQLIDDVALRLRARQRHERGRGRPRAPVDVDSASDLRAAPEIPGPPGSFVSGTAYEDARIHAAAVYCSDGRVGEQMDEFLHRGLDLPRYDRVACPGGPVALAGRLLALWEAHGVLEQLRFLVRVHELQRVVLIAHEGCAYYRQRLGIPEAHAEAEQRADLDKAAWAVHRMEDRLEVRAFYARLLGARVRFEPVAVSLAGGAP